MRGLKHSAETLAEVVGTLLSGMGVSETARKLKLPKSTVARIKANLGPELEQVGTETRENLDELLLAALGSNLKAQKQIVETASEPEYLRKQAAGDIAQLYEALADRAIRLLEAASLNEEIGDRGPGTGDGQLPRLPAENLS